MGFLTFFGRVLIVTAIVSSAYYHLEHPENSISEFKDNYATIDALSNQYLKFDIPLDQVFPPLKRQTGKSQPRYLESSKP